MRAFGVKSWGKRWQGAVGVLGIVMAIAGSLVVADAKSGADQKPAVVSAETYRQLRAETDAMLERDVLQVWFPRCVDEKNGGFLSNFSRDWKPIGTPSQFSVFQGRMTWIAGQIVVRRPEQKGEFAKTTTHGVDYLVNTLWDKEYGGFYWGLDGQGRISQEYGTSKHLYGMSFAIYGLVSAYEATKDPRALEYAQKGFRWIEEHAHDSENGGYFEWLTREGKPVPAENTSGVVSTTPIAGFPIGYKSMNTHIHLLESFTMLYEVWKDDLVRQRVEELLAIVRDKISVEPGAMNLYFTNAWRAYPDHDSYGHDVETAYLMLEAEQVLGKGHDPRTERHGAITGRSRVALWLGRKIGRILRARTCGGLRGR